MVWLAVEACGRPRGSYRPAAPGVNEPRGPKRRPDSPPPAQILSVITAHHFVADAVGEFADPRLQRGTPFRRGEAAALDFARPDYVGKATRRRYNVLDRGPA